MFFYKIQPNFFYKKSTNYFSMTTIFLMKSKFHTFFDKKIFYRKFDFLLLKKMSKFHHFFLFNIIFFPLKNYFSIRQDFLTSSFHQKRLSHFIHQTYFQFYLGLQSQALALSPARTFFST